MVGDFLRGEVTSLDVEEWFLQRDYAASSNATEPAERERSRRWLELAKQTVLSILPGVTDLVPRSTGGPSGQIRLHAVTEYGTVPFRELGFGMQSTLAWVVDLAVRMMTAYPDSDDPLSEPAVCLVDEIDLHLHPKWQRVLLQQLSERFPNVQFIATAHSPLIVQAAPDANVVVLRREKDRVVIDRAPESVRNWRVDQILTSDLFGLPSARPAALDELFAEREKLLAKEKPTAKDRARLDAIREEIGANPQGESPTLLEAEELLLELTRDKVVAAKSSPSRRRKA
ncbi:MAG: AAA family ATPase [Polyangiales bacterium]